MTAIRDDLPTLGDLALGVLPGLEKHGLRAGCHMHAFLSGGGCRVVRMERPHGLISARDAKLQNLKFGLVGYGDNCNVEPALIDCARNLLGGESEIPYLTGALEPTSKLDHWLRQGATFDAFLHAYENLIVFELHGWGHYECPSGLVERVIRTGKAEEHEQRGFRYLVEPFTFPGNGAPGVSSQTVFRPKGSGKIADNMWQFTKTGAGSTLHEAIEAAFAAPEVEHDDEG